MIDLNRKYAWYTIKSAIRTYAKDPSDQHAQQVEAAWREIRRTETPSHWREWRVARFSSDNGSGQSGQAH